MKKLLSVFMAMLMLFSLNATAFAADVPNTNNVSIISTNQKNSIAPASTIGGYARGTISNDSPNLLVHTSGSGIGGMGITVKNTCTAGNYRIGMYLIEGTDRLVLDNVTAYTNREFYFNDLLTYNAPYYVFTFVDIPEGVSFDCKIWIYG